jgi:hypothetical protein
MPSSSLVYAHYMFRAIFGHHQVSLKMLMKLLLSITQQEEMPITVGYMGALMRVYCKKN